MPMFQDMNKKDYWMSFRDKTVFFNLALIENWKDCFLETIYIIFIKSTGFYIRLKFIIIKIFVFAIVTWDLSFWNLILNSVTVINENRKGQSQKHSYVGSNWVCQSFCNTLVYQLNLRDHSVRKIPS